MKKILTLLLAVCALTLTSCKKEHNDVLTTLNGTTWEIARTDSSGKPMTSTLTFDKTTFKMVIKAENSKSEMNSTYTYEAPIVTVDVDSDLISGIVSETEIVFSGPSDEKIIFIRK